MTSSPGSPVGPVAVIVPTYNERDNIEIIAKRVRSAVPDAHLLIVDDNSPDGTGEIADKLAGGDPNIHVLHRAGKAGLGAAYIAGFRWALERDYGAMVEMDADGSHQPEELPSLLNALAHADLVLGSRYVPGGSTDAGWSLARRLNSRVATILAPDPHASSAVITLVLPPEISSQKLGDQLQASGFLLSYQSEYLWRRNWIQICLMGDCSRQSLVALLTELRKMSV